MTCPLWVQVSPGPQLLQWVSDCTSQTWESVANGQASSWVLTTSISKPVLRARLSTGRCHFASPATLRRTIVSLCKGGT